MSKTKLYRIYTEHTENIGKVMSCLDSYLDGYTLLDGVGVWKRKREHSLIIEIITDRTYTYMLSVALDVKRINKQEAVYLTMQDIQAELV